MGDDFANHQVFASDDAAAVRRELVALIGQHLSERGYTEITAPDEEARSIAIGPAARWIVVLDSSSATDAQDMPSFDELSRAVSRRWPVVDIVMSDSAAVHFYLYRDGELIDKFGNAAFPCFAFKASQEAQAYRGRPELWTNLFAAGLSPDVLRAVWVQEVDSSSSWRPGRILAETAALLDWPPLLCHVGYRIDYDGFAVKYDEHYAGEDCDLTGMDELHFRRPQRAR